jgi:hypothetical protein
MSRGLFLFWALVLCGRSLASDGFASSTPTPLGTRFSLRPTIAWPIVATADKRIVGARLTLNEKTVDAHYDARRGEIVYVPAEPLAPGRYDAHAEALFDDDSSVDQEWTFTLRAGPSTPIAPVRPEQQIVLATINALRRNAGLAPATLDPRLCAAAQGQSTYIARSGRPSHEQTPGTTGFTGISLADRLEAVGIDTTCSEGIHVGVEDAAGAVRSLWDAPYHRIALLQPGNLVLGGGVTPGCVTIVCQDSGARGLVVWPADGQTQVPICWQGDERPSPLRLYPALAGRPVGYILSATFFGEAGDRIASGEGSLTDPTGTPVPCQLSTPDRDNHLDNTALLIPQRPLQPGARYRAMILLRTASGVVLTRTWSFVTASACPSAPTGSILATFRTVEPGRTRLQAGPRRLTDAQAERSGPDATPRRGSGRASGSRPRSRTRRPG